MKEDIIIELAEIKRVIKEYYKQLYANILENLNETEKGHVQKTQQLLLYLMKKNGKLSPLT